MPVMVRFVKGEDKVVNGEWAECVGAVFSVYRWVRQKGRRKKEAVESWPADVVVRAEWPDGIIAGRGKREGS